MSTYSKRKLFKDDSSLLTIFKRYLFFIFLFLASLIALSVIFGAIFLKTEDPTSKISLCAYLSLFISTLLSAFLLSRSLNERNLLHGLIFGVIIVLLSLFISLFTENDKKLVEGLIVSIGIIIASLLSAYIGRKRDKCKRKFKR